MAIEIEETQSLIERFGRALGQIVHAERPDALRRPVTVAELYQDIAPYRRMRDLAGIEMHADYEHALIRLLAGENGYARLEPDTARDELAVEADAAEPNLSAYRKFAACEVWLTPGEAPAPPHPAVAEAAPPPPPPRPRSAPAEPAPPPPPPPAVVAPDEGPGTRHPESGIRNPESPRAVRCSFCGQALPTDREVRYCPFCGGDQTALRCGDCGEHLEEGWRFCIACGAAAEP